jgi:hypothetical protein
VGLEATLNMTHGSSSFKKINNTNLSVENELIKINNDGRVI